MPSMFQHGERSHQGTATLAGPLDTGPMCNGMIGREDRHYAQEFVGMRARPKK